MLLAATVAAVGANWASSPAPPPVAGHGFPIELAQNATPAERTAAEELSRHLAGITGGSFPIHVESEHGAAAPSIHVGPTRFAQVQGMDAAGLGEEEWVIRSVKGSLLLCGGRPRGTLYAVYHFLEDHLGVRWWTPYEQSVPRRAAVALDGYDSRGRPAFGYRDVSGVDGASAFHAHNRLNGYLSELGADYGGSVAFGPPSQVHNFFRYVPPEEYFHGHPEFFSELAGVRTAGRSQLCLTNPDLLELVGRKLERYIEQAEAEARRHSRPAPRLFDFSQNDWGGFCTCASCSAIASREGSQSGPLVGFLNPLAQRISPSHPEVLLETLAYHYTFWPPDKLELADNVVVRLSALQRRDFSKPVSHPFHAEYQQAIDGWRRKTRHLWIWDYSVTFGRHGDLPLPNLRVLADDFRYYLEHGVEGMYIQHEYPISADLRDLKQWVMLKLLEDPYRDVDALIAQFTDGFYGRAGKWIRRYLQALEQSAARTPSRIPYPSRPAMYHYLDSRFVPLAQRLFDEAEGSVADEPVLLRRVRHARLSLDRATLYRWNRLTKDWEARGLPQQRRLDPRRIIARYRQTWVQQIELRVPASQEARHLAELERELAGFRYLVRAD